MSSPSEGSVYIFRTLSTLSAPKKMVKAAGCQLKWLCALVGPKIHAEWLDMKPKYYDLLGMEANMQEYGGWGG